VQQLTDERRERRLPLFLGSKGTMILLSKNTEAKSSSPCYLRF